MIAIRDWQIDDAFAFHKLSMDPYFRSRRLKQYLYPDTFLNTVTILETYQSADDRKFRIQAITVQNQVCGFIQFEKKDDFCGELSYWIGHEYWNHGIASQAVHQMCQIIFREFSIFKIFARVQENNIASKKVLYHNGFVCVNEDQEICIFERYR